MKQLLVEWGHDPITALLLSKSVSGTTLHPHI